MKNHLEKAPSAFETALLQFTLLFVDVHDEDKALPSGGSFKAERIMRIVLSWTLLLASKIISIMSPLYFQGLVEKANDADASFKSTGSFHDVIRTSAIGLMIGYCTTKIVAAVVQLISEMILFPATASVAEVLPNRAFSAAIRNAYKRNLPVAQKKTHSFDKPSIHAASEKGTAGYARRVLDRGLKAANGFLYRLIYNLLPAYVESICLVILISFQTTHLLGATSAVVAFSFVYITSAFMSYRVGVIRRQLQAEGVANGFAEDSLSLAETVAAFGTMAIEEKRYADGLKNVSTCEIAVRQSFSLLKLIQVLILGMGTTAIMFCAWMPASNISVFGVEINGYGASDSTIARNLMLSQSLFAQLCAALSMVGQHFRECVSTAEDLRELEEIIRTAKLQKQTTEDIAKVPSDEIHSSGDRLPNRNEKPPILEVRDLHFAYPATVSLQERNSGGRKLSDAPPVARKVILKNISFSIPSGGYSIGIVGPSGSGKSTLLRVLLNLESIASNNNSGQILINGVDITRHDRVPFFSMVGQENDLFRGLNLVENVKYGSDNILNRCTGNPQVIAEKKKVALENAAVDSQLQPVVDKLKDGWNSSVGPRGRLLSGGERQRVCLARALYRQEISLAANILPGSENNSNGNSDKSSSSGCILLMDEVTSSLDAKTESIVIDAIMSRVKKGATAVLIAHRLSSVQQCDLILVMRDGEIIERGNHSELIRNGQNSSRNVSIPKNTSISNLESKIGWYSEAWNLQSSSPVIRSKLTLNLQAEEQEL